MNTFPMGRNHDFPGVHTVRYQGRNALTDLFYKKFEAGLLIGWNVDFDCGHTGFLFISISFWSRDSAVLAI